MPLQENRKNTSQERPLRTVFILMAKLTTEVTWEFGQDSADSQVLDVAPFKQQVFLSMYRPSSQNLVVTAFLLLLLLDLSIPEI